ILVEDVRKAYLLDRDLPVEQFVTGSPDGAHPAAADRLDEPVAPGQQVSGGRTHGLQLTDLCHATCRHHAGKLLSSSVKTLDWRRHPSVPAADGEHGSGSVLEEVVPLVIDDDESGKIDDLDLPNRLHSELRVLEHLDLLDAILREAGRGTAD